MPAGLQTMPQHSDIIIKETDAKCIGLLNLIMFMLNEKTLTFREGKLQR